MTLSKFLKYAAIGIAIFIYGEFHSHIISPLWKKLMADPDDEEILELICCRQPLNKKWRLCKGIKFDGAFSHGHCTQVLQNLIRSSKRSIHLAVYIFTSRALAEALIKVHKKGVKVCVVIDQSMKISSGSVVSSLLRNGIEVRIYPEGMMHNKLALFDVPFDEASNGKLVAYPSLPNYDAIIALPKHGLTVTGSLNWTNEALNSNRENFIAVSNKKVCETAASEFYDVWKSSIPVKL